MRILQINSVCGTGSTGKIAVGIHDLLKSNGHESSIAYGRGAHRNCDTTIKIGNILDNYMHVLLTRIFDRHGFGSKRATRRFIKEIEKFKPDIVHMHNIHGYYINISVLFDYLKAKNVPTVWTLHDCWPYTGHCAYYTYIDCSKWKAVCNKCPAKRSYPKSFFADLSQKNYFDKKSIFLGHQNTVLVTPSKWLSNELAESYMSKYPIEIINNGIDIDVFKYRDSSFRKIHNLDNRNIILGVANIWEARKGLARLVELANYLDDTEVIVIVGKIPNKSDKKRVSSLYGKIVYIEQTSNAIQLAEIYSAANVYYNPTYEDNYPTTNIEALCCGCPVITHNVGGSAESLETSNGICIDSSLQIEYVLDEIRKLYSNSYGLSRIENEKKSRLIHNQSDKFLEYIMLYKRMRYN